MKMKAFSLERILAKKYFHLLVMLIIYLMAAPYVEHGEKAWGLKLIGLILLCTIIVCLWSTVSSPKIFWLCVAIAVLPSVLDILNTRFDIKADNEIIEVIDTLIVSFFISMTIVILLKSMFKAHKVTPDMIIGAICVYLLIGIQWTVFFELINCIDPDAIISDGDISFFYFSFTTLTTLGYGDIIPNSNFAKILTNAEAITGQVYLAVLVARLVGLHIAHEIRAHVSTAEKSMS
jgi:hypothetical protein